MSKINLEQFNKFKSVVEKYQETGPQLGGGLSLFIYKWMLQEATNKRYMAPSSKEHKEAGLAIDSANNLVEEFTSQSDFVQSWDQMELTEKQNLIQFSPQSYLSIRKKVSLETVSFNCVGRIKEDLKFDEWHYRVLSRIVKDVFNLTFMHDISAKKELELKTKIEEKVEKFFPNFKASPQNTVKNVYLNLVNLSILKIVNTQEENTALTDFSLLGQIPYTKALKLNDHLSSLQIFDVSSAIFSRDIGDVSFYLAQEEEIKDALAQHYIELEKKDLDNSIDISSSNKEPSHANLKI